MKVLLVFLKSLLLYLAFVAGGVTLFLVTAPLAGYLPYSDRPGPGWFGSFPALGWSEFWSNAESMAGIGLFLGVLFIIPAAVCLLAIRGLEYFTPRLAVVRPTAAVVSAFVSAYWMAGAGWYIAAGQSLLLLAAALGAVAGAWLLPRKAPNIAPSGDHVGIVRVDA